LLGTAICATPDDSLTNSTGGGPEGGQLFVAGRRQELERANARTGALEARVLLGVAEQTNPRAAAATLGRTPSAGLMAADCSR